MGRNKQVYCKVCLRTMRNDNLKEHMKVHEKYNGNRDEICSSRSRESTESTSTFSSEESVESNTLSKVDEEGLRKILRKENQEYKEKIKLGQAIYKLLGQEDILQEGLNKVYKEALDLYIKRKQSIDHQNIILRPWQGDLLRQIENPTERKVIWVRGAQCGEGKSWFQEFVESRFGWERVVCAMDIKLKKSSICHVLGKRPLTTTDIFLFNVGKAKAFDEVNYEVLEKIKDGRILASKYDSRELKFKIPNVVVVFSNDKPDVKQLALDRWLIFSIINGDLVDNTKEYLIPKGKMRTTEWNGCKEEYTY